MGTTTPVAAGVPEAPGPINHFGRILGVFFSPKATFEDIARRPTWIVPVALMTVLGVATAFFLNQKVDWRDVAAKRIEDSPRSANLSAEQKEQQIAMSAKISPVVSYCFGALLPTLGVLVVALVLWLAYNVIGGAGTNFSTSLGVVAHVFSVTLLSGVLFIVILLLKAPGTVDLDNPVATNVGAFLPESTPKALMSLGRSVDLFAVWMLVLLSIGFTAVNPKKLRGKALSIAIAVWAVWVAVKMGGAWIFS
jgi:Yip1 domain